MGNDIKKLISRNKSIALLLFLFGYNNLFAGTGSYCRSYDKYENSRQSLSTEYRKDICNERSKSMTQLLQEKHSFLYLKIPDLGDEYLEYRNEELEYNLEPDRRKERALPINIEWNTTLINPLKEDVAMYKVSSKLKEQIILENTTITRRNCTFMALGSEYLFPVPANQGYLSVILYFDYSRDVARYNFLRSLGSHNDPHNYFDQFIHRGLYTEVNFKPGRIYQIEIAINPNSALPRGSYNATTLNTFETMNTVPGFTITLKELPPNTKFAFDGKDDIGKTYEQVKKEFILYDKSAE